MKKFFIISLSSLGITSRNALESASINTLIDEHHPMGVIGNNSVCIVSAEISIRQLMYARQYLESLNVEASRVDHFKLTGIEYVDEGRYIMHFQGVHETSKRLQVHTPFSDL